MELQETPTADAGMLIRRPVEEVFQAFTNPETTTQFWFTRSTGPLEPGATVTWYWDPHEASAEVRVTKMRSDEYLQIQWGDFPNRCSTVDWAFEARTSDTTYVSVQNHGFSGTDDEVVAQALDASGGFALTFAAAKAYLEHGIDLRIVEDRI